MSGAPPRLSSATLVDALLRRVQAEGGFATVLRRGDSGAGAIIVECCERGVRTAVLERGADLLGNDGWRRVALTGGDSAYASWLDKRKGSDPDLWVIELDIAQAERFAAETIGSA